MKIELIDRGPGLDRQLNLRPGEDFSALPPDDGFLNLGAAARAPGLHDHVADQRVGGDRVVARLPYASQNGHPDVRTLDSDLGALHELADLVLTDTETHRRWIGERLAPTARTATVYLGAEPFFRPTAARTRRADEPLRVLFYGQYVPLHGTDVIVEAAALLAREAGIEITMIGTGPERELATRLATMRHVTSVRFEDWEAYEQLPARLAACDVALGIFGPTSKARMVIPTKVYQAAAMGRAVVTMDTPALREVFTPDADVLTVREGDPRALAAMLRRLRDDPALAPRIGGAAGRLLGEHLDPAAQGARMRTVLAAAFPDLATRFAPASAALSPAFAGLPLA